MKLLLLSGLGADGRLFRELGCPGLDLIMPDHREPESGESLPDYAKRVAERGGVTSDMAVGGASFGGFVAAEIAAQRPCAGLVLIGSALSPLGIHPLLTVVEKVARGVSDGALRQAFRIDPRLVSLVGPLSPPHRELLLDMFKTCPVTLLRRGADMVFRWKGVADLRCPVHRIHGAKDRIIRAERREVDAWIEDGGHLPTLTHPEEVSRFLVRRILARGT